MFGYFFFFYLTRHSPDSPRTTPSSPPLPFSDLGKPAGLCESAGAAGGIVELGDLIERSALDGGGDELGDAIAARDRERRGAQIGEDHLDLAAIVAVDSARRVEAGDRKSTRLNSSH